MFWVWSLAESFIIKETRETSSRLMEADAWSTAKHVMELWESWGEGGGRIGGSRGVGQGHHKNTDHSIN